MFHEQINNKRVTQKMFKQMVDEYVDVPGTKVYKNNQVYWFTNEGFLFHLSTNVTRHSYDIYFDIFPLIFKLFGSTDYKSLFGTHRLLSSDYYYHIGNLDAPFIDFYETPELMPCALKYFNDVVNKIKSMQDYYDYGVMRWKENKLAFEKYEYDKIQNNKRSWYYHQYLHFESGRCAFALDHYKGPLLLYYLNKREEALDYYDRAIETEKVICNGKIDSFLETIKPYKDIILSGDDAFEKYMVDSYRQNKELVNKVLDVEIPSCDNLLAWKV